jgi:hypothetical protein
MYAVQRYKPRYDPRLLSFTFEVMADQMVQLREEKDVEPDAVQTVWQSPEQFLTEHLVVGTVPSPV